MISDQDKQRAIKLIEQWGEWSSDKVPNDWYCEGNIDCADAERSFYVHEPLNDDEAMALDKIIAPYLSQKTGVLTAIIFKLYVIKGQGYHVIVSILRRSGKKGFNRQNVTDKIQGKISDLATEVFEKYLK